MISDFIDPASEDWRSMDDAEVWHAAKAGVPQAVKELARREGGVSLTAASPSTVDLAADPVFATTDGPNLTIPTGSGHRYHHGWVRIDAAGPTAVERATRAVSTDGHALLHGRNMVPTAQKIIERVKAAGHTPTVSRVDVGGTPHLHIARRGTSDYTAAPAATVDLAFTEALHPRGGKGTAAGGKFVPKNSTPAPANGSSLPANVAANVRDFQRRNGLPVTGIIDPATAAKIRATLAAKTGKGNGKGRKKKPKAAKKTSTALPAIAGSQGGQRMARGLHGSPRRHH